MNSRRADGEVLVVGGGVIGMSIAHALAEEGREVVVVERGEPGREASWAGGGILTPINPYDYPPALVDLCARGPGLYPDFVAAIEAEAGFSVELRSTGLLRLAFVDDDADLPAIADYQHGRGRQATLLDAAALRQLEPTIGETVTGALHEPEVQQVRNPRLLKALRSACARLGVQFRLNAPVESLRVDGDRVTGVQLEGGSELAAGEVVLAAGAWSRAVLERSLQLSLPIVPVQGVMVLLERYPPVVESVVIGRGRYLIPRADGCVLIGSTLEERGFDKTVRLESVHDLLGIGAELVPAIRTCGWRSAWAGLRPGTPDRLPYLGRPSGIHGLVVATGHYRNGLVLAPVTAQIVSDLVHGRSPDVDLEPFAIDRGASGATSP